jgi:hypothetical protein
LKFLAGQRFNNEQCRSGCLHRRLRSTTREYRNWYPVTINASVMVETMQKSSVRYGISDKKIFVNKSSFFLNSLTVLTFRIRLVYARFGFLCDITD